MPAAPIPNSDVKPPRSTRRSHSRSKSLIIGSTVAFLGVAMLLASVKLLPRRSELPTQQKESALASPAGYSKSNAVATAPASSSLIADDGRTLWVSPTNGNPLDLAYLAPGSQCIFAIRPAAFLKHAEGVKVIAALGPNGEHAVQSLEEMTTIPLKQIERLTIGCQIANDGRWHFTFVVQPTLAVTQNQLLAAIPGAMSKEQAGKQYWSANGWAHFLPAGDRFNRFVIAREQSIGEIIELAGEPPPLRRDVERILARTDSDRHVTIVFAPSALFAEGQNLFVGELASARDPLFWFLGDELSGAALSMHWGETFLLEFTAVPTLETSMEQAARLFDQRVHEIPDRLKTYVKALNPEPYGGQVIARLPEMFEKLAAYTRSGYEKDYAVIRCYLPVVAGHNLLMAAELTLAESTAGNSKSLPPPGSAASRLTSQSSNAAIDERLAKVTSLKFGRDTLESALEQLANDIGVPIVICGPDLQADGITKNQSFSIDISNKPAAEILVEILRQANPDRTASAANDPRQKLVYIVERKPDKTEQIVVTTRARAVERHDELPAPFREKKG